MQVQLQSEHNSECRMRIWLVHLELGWHNLSTNANTQKMRLDSGMKGSGEEQLFEGGG